LILHITRTKPMVKVAYLDPTEQLHVLDWND
jgi:hypothetical protein